MSSPPRVGKPNLLRRGLIGGTGGASNIPFLSEAPAGRATVSTTDVVEIRTGSPISDFLIDIFLIRAAFRFVPEARLGVLAEKLDVIGVELAERGGVGFAKGEIGVPRPEDGAIPGLRGPTPGEGLGELKERAGDSEPFGGKPGEGRGEGSPSGWTIGF